MTTEHPSTLPEPCDPTLGVKGARAGELSTEEMHGLIRDLQSTRRQLELQNEKLRRHQEGLEAARDEYSQLYDASPVGYLTVGVDGLISQANLTVAGMLGVDRRLIVGNSLYRYVSKENLDLLCRHHTRLSGNGGSHTCEVQMLRRDNTSFYAQMESAGVKDDEGRTVQFHSIITDVTERRKFEDQVRHEARHDVLTGIPNRTLFEDRLTQELSHARRDAHQVALLFIDLNRFKHVNDTLGHVAGDALLQQAAKRIRGCVRDSDTAARIGGDEFAVILPGITGARDAVRVAESIIGVLSKPFLVESKQCVVGASIGIATYPEHGTEGRSLLRNADTAMYRAKRSGKSTHRLFSEELAKHPARRPRANLLERELRTALREYQLVLHYQPQLDLQTGELSGVEALLRWNHPRRGLLPPSQFLPAAESTGLIDPIGDWVLQTACRQYKAWMRGGVAPRSLSVNVSAGQVRKGHLVDMVRRCLSRFDAWPGYLQLEFTEALLSDTSDQTALAIRGLSELGVQLSVDDFGTGNCSLGQLQRFPIHTVKVDRSLIRNVVTDERNAAITTALIAMARTSKKKIVAGGVEKNDQVSFLRRSDCTEIQGYYFSRPLPTEKCTDFLCQYRSPTPLGHS